MPLSQKIQYGHFDNFVSFLKRNQWFVFYLTFTLLAGSGLSIIQNVSGLDASWWDLTVDASRYHKIQTNEFIGTYGPYGFLEFSLPTWRLGLIFAFSWKAIISISLFTSCYIIAKKNLAISDVKIGAISFFLAAFSSYFFPPSQIIVVCLLLIWAHSKRNKVSYSFVRIQIFSILSSILFLIKLFPATLAVPLILSTILSFNDNKINFVFLKRIFVYLASSGVWTYIQLLILGFDHNQIRNWLYGYYQMTIGYKAMANEEPGRIWEYFIFIALSVIFLLQVRKLNTPKIDSVLLAIFLYFVFLYGFNRHDTHSITSFGFVTCAFFVVSLIAKFQKQVPIFLFSIIILFAVSNFSLSGFFDFSSRMQGSINYLKLIDPRYVESLTASNIQHLQNSYPIDQKILQRISRDTVSIYPWDQLLGKAWNLNVSSPPAAQMFTAYTPWLDSQNVQWIKSDHSSEYMLWSKPKSIDLRNPRWDSPAFQIEVFCRYREVMSDPNWVLMQKRDDNICLGKSLVSKHSIQPLERFKLPTSNEDLIYISISQEQSNLRKFMRSVFKPLRADTLILDGTRTHFVWLAKDDLVTSVPKKYDLNENFEYGQIETFQALYPTTLTVYSIALK